jgi:hypothetical protein
MRLTGPATGPRAASFVRGLTMADKRDIHVIPQGRDWAVKKEGSARASRIFPTKELAMAHARLVAKRNKVELVVHRQDGRLQDADSYGADPSPPIDRVR